MITEKELQAEKEYLSKVIEILKDEIEENSQKVKSLSNNIQEQMNYAWDKTNRLSDTEFIYAVADIQKRSVFAQNSQKKLNSYKKMLNNTYFARIDFDDGEEVFPIYIGITTLQKDENFYVFDWRAPISSMFYNNQIGEASYTISNGEKISGKITLKRQYKIENGEIKEIFDTDMQIVDNILKEILSSNATNKMKNIVNTIQKEQNEIIRKNDADIIFIQGPAGSGKTSIAMHKIAYLLYSERDKINNSNILIISPNEIFTNYISDVLPGIGEDNVCNSTFLQIAKAYVKEFEIVSKIEDVYDVIYSKKSQNTDKFNEILLKFNDIYINLINFYISNNLKDFLNLDKIEISEETIVSKEEIDDLIKTTPLGNLTVYSYGKKLIEKIFYIASQRTKKQLTLEKVKNEYLEEFVKIKQKLNEFYKNLYGDFDLFLNLYKLADPANQLFDRTKLFKIFSITQEYILNDKIEFQEVIPYMYFKSKMFGIKPNTNIKYVVIDEAQDYTYGQLLVISQLFKNSKITFLADFNQCILPFNSIVNYELLADSIKPILQDSTMDQINLKKTYRSTFEINDFSKLVLNDSSNHFSQIDRHGDNVELISMVKFSPEEILNLSINLKKSYNSVAIICKNNEETVLYKQAVANLNLKNQFCFVTKDDTVFVDEKIMIIPSYISKGLEFDAVIISNASTEMYGEFDRNLFYVSITRALHKLVIFHSGKLTSLLPERVKWDEKSLW